jgi:hypothetical protein
MLTKLKYLHSLRRLNKTALTAFSGGHGHHEKPYDWRDDPKHNTELYDDVRDRGWDPSKYNFPYDKAHDGWYMP